MFVFFLVIVAAVIVNAKVKSKYKEIWHGMSNTDLKGLISYPIGYVLLCYIFAYITKLGVSITASISSLFNVDTYIGFLGNGWVGIIAQWLRSEGIIGDIVTPIAVVRYNAVVSTIVPIATIVEITAIVIGIIYLTQLKRHNVTILYWCYYALVACTIVSAVVVLIGVSEFAALIRTAINDFSLNGIFVLILAITIACVCIYTSRFRMGIHSLSHRIHLEKYTWNQLKSKIGLNSDGKVVDMKESHIMWISLSISAIVSVVLILSIVFLNGQLCDEYEQIEFEQEIERLATQIEESQPSDDIEQIVSAAEQNVSVEDQIIDFYVKLGNDDEYDWSMTTDRFYQHMKGHATEWDIFRCCQDCPSGQVSVSQYPEIENSYEVQLTDEQGKLYLVLIWIMVEDNGMLKLDNIIYTSRGYDYNAYVNTDRPFVDYSQPCSTGIDNEMEIIEE